eukprot:SAG31_NODE_33261_length_345_cov_10.203252_1_plen_99_part_01
MQTLATTRKSRRGPPTRERLPPSASRGWCPLLPQALVAPHAVGEFGARLVPPFDDRSPSLFGVVRTGPVVRFVANHQVADLYRFAALDPTPNGPFVLVS